MANIYKCPECGGTEIGKGKFYGSAAMIPTEKKISLGSTVFADVCTNCGLIIQLQAEKPDIFMKKE
jgi:predicted RNA-binding Zn-ribbon protein involved in translation (DUF1610 family)